MKIVWPQLNYSNDITVVLVVIPDLKESTYPIQQGLGKVLPEDHRLVALSSDFFPFYSHAYFGNLKLHSMKFLEEMLKAQAKQ